MTRQEKRERNVKILATATKYPSRPLWKIGKDFGVSHPTVSRVVTDAGCHRHSPRNLTATAIRVREILSRIIRGEKYAGIAAAMGIAHETVSRAAHANGIWKTGWEGNPLRKGHRALPREKGISIVQDLLDIGLSYSDIAERNGVCFNTVHNVAKRHGLTRGLSSGRSKRKDSVAA